jgi:hypothetical protein
MIERNRIVRGIAVAVAAAALASTACPPPAQDESPDAAPRLASWLVGDWAVIGYRDGGKVVPAMTLSVQNDGTWQHASAGVSDGDGEWTADGGAVVLDGKPITARLDNCTAFRASWKGMSVVYSRGDVPSGCPSPPSSLEAHERCFLGEYEQDGTAVSSHWTRTAQRTQIHTAVAANREPMFATWRVDLDEKNWPSLCTTTLDGVTTCDSPQEWRRLDERRIGSKDPGCEEQPYVCDSACGDGAVCDVYNGDEGCCWNDYPHLCPAIHSCYTEREARETECATVAYGDPAVACQPDEIDVSAGAVGRVCAPRCDPGCPAAFDGTVGKCVATAEGQYVCVLGCSTTADCPDGMTCATGYSACVW